MYLLELPNSTNITESAIPPCVCMDQGQVGSVALCSGEDVGEGEDEGRDPIGISKRNPRGI